MNGFQVFSAPMDELPLMVDETPIIGDDFMLVMCLGLGGSALSII